MKKIFTDLNLFIVNLALLVAIPLQANAATASNALAINPRKDYTVAPGETKKDTINVRNVDQNNTLHVTITVLDFQAAGQNGSPELLLDREQPTRWSLKPYLTVPDSVDIGPGKSADVPLTISIPKGAGGGSLYSAIRFSSSGGGTNGNVGMTGSATALVFERVPGNATDNLLLKKFGAFVPTDNFVSGTYQNFFGASKPKYLSYTLQNTGNVVDEPVGSAQIKNMFGKQFTIVSNINPNHNLVLLGQTRRIDVCIIAPAGSNVSNTPDSSMDLTKCPEPGFWPGRYTAKLDLIYGDNGSPSNEITATSSFWYLPAWFIIAVIVVLAVLVGIGWLVWNAVQNARGHKYRR